MKQKFRLILAEAYSASFNMALDESLAKSQEHSDALPAIRFYTWDKTSLSIGYFEKIESQKRLFEKKLKNLPIVRRITGGGAVLHGKDLTFSITMKLPTKYFANDVKSSYLKINEAVRVGLKPLYNSIDYADCRNTSSQSSKQLNRICFEAPSCYDLLLNQKKILGASQRRIGAIFLHQSTLFLENDARLLQQHICNGFKQVWGIDLVESRLTDEEMNTAKKIEIERYSDVLWADTVLTKSTTG